MILTCPSKTFLLGEYVALKGGPALLIATEPRFQLEIEQGRREAPFHPESPAGRLWKAHLDQVQNWKVTFTNPARIGGLGASSAEFLLLKAALQVRGALAWEAQLEVDLADILRDYAEVCADKQTKPSGADLVSQFKGRVTLFERSRGHLESGAWGFAGLSILLFSTGVKVPTHDHLAELGSLSLDALQSQAEKGAQAWLARDAEVFIEATRATRHELLSLGLEASSTTALVNELLQDSDVLAAKGCGALGADIVLVLCASEKKLKLQAGLSKRLSFIASDEHITQGLQVLPQWVRPAEISL